MMVSCKKQKCKNATGICKLNTFLGSQLWKLDNNILKNYYGHHKSDIEWNFKTKDDLIYIENTSKAKVLGITDDDKVILEDFEENKTEQLWKKGVANLDGYFILENSKVPKVLTTGIFIEDLEIKGNTRER